MSKRILSLLLILAMLITGLVFPASAATDKAINGEKYTLVTTEAELVAALQESKNILLQNDIELTAATFPTGRTFGITPKNNIIDGNGYTLFYPKARTTALFNINPSTTSLKGDITIRNLSFGSQESPIVINGVDGLFKYTKDQSFRLIVENVNFYVQKKGVSANSGAIFAKIGTIAHFRDCMLDIEMTDVTGGSLHGGWFGEVLTGAQVELDNCTTIGEIKSPGGAAAFVGQNTTGDVEFNNCKNFANVTASLYAAGFVANMGMGATNTYAADCINYGNITSTGTAYDAIAGGIFGRVSSRATIATWRLHVIYRCSNYGNITAGATAGGIMGRNHDFDYDGRTFITLGACENFGVVKGTQYAGGIIGAASPMAYAAELTDCVNIGTVISSEGYAGNFAGVLSGGASINQVAVRDAIVDGGYAAGVVSGASGKSGAIAGLDAGTYKIGAGAYAGRVVSVTTPKYSNVTYFGTLATVPAGVTKTENLNTLLADLGARLDTELIAADSSDQTARIVLANPVLRGIQLRAIKDNKLSVRLIAGLYAKDAYKSYGFEVTVTNADGTSTTKTYNASELVTEIEQTVGGQDGTVKAERVAAKYLYTAVLADLPATGRASIKITPVAVSADGAKTYTGSTKMLVVVNGRVTNETMAINGVLLENFAIIYKSTNTMAEKTLATHLSKRIAELTGINLPVIKEKGTHNRAYTINVGTVSEAGTVPAGRNISTMADSVSLAITGDNTAQLGEAVMHFIDLLAEKVGASDNSFYITTPIQAPADTEISIMSFNMGASDDNHIKTGEWDLLVEYLPDVWTAQEPWAGFLDDFCNNFAVRPTTKFKEKLGTNGDVMETDVDNKAFEGNDYYGIYWGMPRWVPDGPNHQGKASYSVIFYAKDRFTVNEEKSGTFMFSDTPDVIGSKVEGSSHPRCATYATLTDVNTGEEFVVVNVHLDHVAKQVEQAEILIKELIKRVGKDTPMMITGDMNSNRATKAIQYMMNNDTMPLASFDVLASECYWSDAASFGVIDWIFTNTPELVDVTNYRFCNDFNMFYSRWTNSNLQMYMPSDHPAIYAEFRFK